MDRGSERQVHLIHSAGVMPMEGRALGLGEVLEGANDEEIDDESDNSDKS